MLSEYVNQEGDKLSPYRQLTQDPYALKICY